MKIVVYGEEQPQDVVRLRLMPCPVCVNKLALCVVDESGQIMPDGYILHIREDGTIERNGFSDRIPLRRNVDGLIRLEGEKEKAS